MRSILNEGVVVNVNSLSNGEAIEIVSTASTQSTANVNFKMNTTEQTSPNTNDWILIADNTTGKIVKRMLYSNFINNISNWTLSNSLLYPLSTSTDVLIGKNTSSGIFKLQVEGNSFLNGSLTTQSIVLQDINNTGMLFYKWSNPGSPIGSYTLIGTIKPNFFTNSLVIDLKLGGINNCGFLHIDGEGTGNANRIVFKDLDLTHNITLQAPNITSDIILTLPTIAGTLAVSGEESNWTLTNSGLLYPNNASTNVAIGNNAISSGFKFAVSGKAAMNGLIVIQDANNECIRFDNTADSGSNFTTGLMIRSRRINTTNFIELDSPLFTGANSSGQRCVYRGYTYDTHNNTHTIEVPNISGSTTITLPSTTGTLALQGEESNWTLSSSLLYPNSNTTNVLIGKSSPLVPGNPFKLEVEGNVYISGQLQLNDAELSGLNTITFNDTSENNLITLIGGEADSDITITLPEVTGQILVENSPAVTLGSGYTWNGAVIPAEKVNVGLELNTSTAHIGYQNFNNLLALKRDITFGNEVLRLYGQQEPSSSFNSSPFISFYVRDDGDTTGTQKGILEYNNVEGYMNIGNTGLNIVNSSTYSSSAVPTNTEALLYLDVPQSSSTSNVYNSVVRYGSPINGSSANFTNWVYHLSSQSREFYGFSYYSGSGAGADIYSLEKNGDLNIAGTCTCSSDERIKTNIVNADLDECIDILKSINLKKYNYTEDYIATYEKTTEKVYGFLAQDIISNQYISYCGKIKGMPMKLNNEDGSLSRTIDDFLTIRKSEILSVLWGCCNKFALENETLKTKVETLENEIENIKNLLINNNII